ncbi:MAG: universal stress protein [Acidobacteria bacterium]|nr:universal stress protein [Acidobacteriota bacterium]MBV9067084.1 universal stress protein [Acidobacteriota bacterium]MBV9184286.1 universal stress protein [Acidobacteriota bacterium]
MYPWRRIVIPTDFSTAAEWSFDSAVQLAGATGAELVILHVRSTRTSNPDELRFPADDALYAYAEQHELEKLRDHARRRNADVATRLVVQRAPDAGAAICQTAIEENADLIVISTHARHHVAHLIIGSTTLNVLSGAPVPVLAIRYGIQRRRGFGRILVPVHLNQRSTVAASLAAAIAKRENAEVHLMIVCNDGNRVPADALIGEMTADLFAGVNVKPVVLQGKDIDAELVRYARGADADALFLNAAANEISVRKKDIIRQVDAPVMLVPAAPPVS